MLEILGLTYNDLPPVVPVAGTISGNGATIGRGNDNVIILPDPMRLISRQHLKFILVSENEYWVRNISSGNPVFVNETELASGAECPVKNLDKILVGGYVLQVTYTSQKNMPQVQPTAPLPVSNNDVGGDDFLADLLGPAAASARSVAAKAEAKDLPDLPDPFQYGVVTSKPADIMQTLNASGVDPGSLDSKGDDLINGEDASAMMNELLQDPLSAPASQHSRPGSALDPMAMFEENKGNEAFGDILQAGKNTPSNTPSGVNVTHGSELDALFQLPSAGNKPVPPVADPAPATGLHLQAGKDAVPDIPAGGVGMVHGSELDALFGLSAAPGKPPPGSPAVSPMPGVAPQGVGERPIKSPANIAHGDDIDSLISGLGSEPRSMPQPPQAVQPPQVVQPPQTVQPPQAVQPPPQSSLDPLSMFLQEAKPAGVPPPASVAHASSLATTVEVAPPPSVASARPSVSSAPSTPEASGAAMPSASPDMDELYQAFIEGLGMDLVGRTALDKVFMNMLGQVVRNYTQGTIDLMAGRTVVKQAVRASVTVIAPERNNPLKFSPDGVTAVQSMFGRPLPGFMGPVEAIRSAFVDLRAHQIGVISGMQAALNHVLDRFNPAILADKIPPRGMLENAFSVSHRARLWTEYGQYFYALREKASDHFHEFFGEAFVEAYERAILTVQSGERAGRP